MLWKIYLIIVFGMSLVTFALYGWDKRQAKNDGWRIPENRLHLFALGGGWPGALAGQWFFRHKNRKQKFVLITAMIVGLHLSAIFAAFWFWFQGD